MISTEAETLANKCLQLPDGYVKIFKRHFIPFSILISANPNDATHFHVQAFSFGTVFNTVYEFPIEERLETTLARILNGVLEVTQRVNIDELAELKKLSGAEQHVLN